MSEAFTTAAGASLFSCHTCHQLSQARRLPRGGHAVCSRCGTTLHFRKPNSLARTWALTLTAFVLYIPANLLPIMTVISYGEGEPDTIISGESSAVADPPVNVFEGLLVKKIDAPMLVASRSFLEKSLVLTKFKNKL